MMLLQLPLPKQRDLFFTDQVDQKTVSEITKAIIDINRDDDELVGQYTLQGQTYIRKPIRLFIDSYGGYVYQALGLISVMRNSKAPVHTIVTGCAMSCGFLMLINGHKRFAYKYSTALYHQVSNWGMGGKIQDMSEQLEEVERLQKILEEITIQRTRIHAERLLEIREKKIDWCIPAEEALELRIVDEIIKD
jgi:ATP-dependent Clp protease protease subunit